MAQTPPLGWRSWNAWGNRVSQDNFHASIDALTNKIWQVDGQKNVSLLDIGYESAGIDEGWEGCGQGVNGTQHDANGLPVINKKFPDMPGLVKYGHSKGLKIGFYENGCACGERRALMQNYVGDVEVLNKMGFDGVKLDGCGAQRNMTLYAELMKDTGKSYAIENCHWGRCSSGDDSSCPTQDWCPFNWFRTSGDINASPMSWLRNLQTTIQFQDPKAPLSQPGCWAYPDMLEVGRIMMNGKMNYEWNRAHFGAWCVVSAPLILGLDVTQTEKVAAVIDVISNKEAIQVNQAWAGHPGGLVWSGLGAAIAFPAARACDPTNPSLKQKGWGLKSLAGGNVALQAPGGGCLAVRGSGYPGGAGGTVIADCNSTDPAQTFMYNETTQQLMQPSSHHCVDVHSGGPIVWMYGCTSGPNDRLIFDKNAGTVYVNISSGKVCFGMESDDPAGGAYQSTLQAWAKPLKTGVAVLLINPDTKPHTVDFPISSLPLSGQGVNFTTVETNVRDIWAHKTLSPWKQGATTASIRIGGLDSVFLSLSPK